MISVAALLAAAQPGFAQQPAGAIRRIGFLAVSTPAAFVDKILKGAKPADIPIERPTTFEFVINVKTAKALGLALSTATRMRADREIE